MTAASTIGRVLLVLVCAQFIITLDTTFMNVSLSTLVVDLHTTVTGVQSAITLYALVMAALMIAGAKFGDIIGRKRAFITGLIIYAVGTTVTSLSPSLPVFILGWSILEGVGAALMLPAMMSLIADNFAPGPDRSRAYAVFAASAGVAAALGPIIGGLFTSYLSWRLAFASELLVAIFIFSQRSTIKEQLLPGPSERFDFAGFATAAAGLVTLVFGIILASTYGIVRARTDWVVADQVILSAGSISPTIILSNIGIIILGFFFLVERRRSAKGRPTLLNVDLLKKRAVRAGSTTQMMQALVLTGIIFALSLYVQMELGYSAIQSGLTLLPLSVGVLAFSSISGKYLSTRYRPRGIIMVGFVCVVLGALFMGLTARDATSGLQFAVGLIFMGAGIGMILSQNQNLIISSVEPRYTNETSGVINTFQNIGSSLGTSLSGALILAVFVSTATSTVASSATFNSGQKAQLNEAVINKAQIVSNAQLEKATASLPSDQQKEIISINAEARNQALTNVYFGISALGLIGVLSAYRLPRTAPLSQQKPPDDSDTVQAPELAVS